MKITWEETDVESSKVAITEDASYVICMMHNDAGEPLFGLIDDNYILHGKWITKEEMAEKLNKMNVLELN